MKNKTNVISIVLFLSVFIMLISCEKQKAEWKGIIEEVDGVTVVKNPKEPMFVEDIFSLEEELSIGKAEGRDKTIRIKGRPDTGVKEALEELRKKARIPKYQ